jgi:hypothetical protein
VKKENENCLCVIKWRRKTVRSGRKAIKEEC